MKPAWKHPLQLFLLWSVLCCLWLCPAFAAGHEALFAAAAREVDVPPNLTQAIARVESEDWPWALNIEGRSYFYDSKAEAVTAARQAEASGRSFDVGPMQVNNWWLKRYGIPLEAAFDPAANILLGSWILKQELEREGDTWKAVGRYHSPNAKRGERYANQVRRALERGPLAVAPTRKLPQNGDAKGREKRPALVPSAALALPEPPANYVASNSAGDGGPLLTYRRNTAGFVREAPDESDNQPFVRRMP